MSGIITTGSNPKLLWPGLHSQWGLVYNEHGFQCKELFTTESSSRAYEEDVELIGFGLAPVKEQGKSTSYDTSRQGFTTRYTNKAYALGFIVTYEEQKDNQYAKVAGQRTRRLAFSMRTTKEIVAANVYNRAFNSSFTGGDGVSLLNASHPTDSGNQSNVISVAADLSETAIEDLAIQIGDMKDSRGLLIAARIKKLIIPNELQFTAKRILGSELQNDSADNAINALKSKGTIPSVVMNNYLTDADAWFIQTDVPDGMRHYEREAISFSEDNDFDTKNLKYNCYERYVFGWTDPRGLYGSAGA